MPTVIDTAGRSCGVLTLFCLAVSVCGVSAAPSLALHDGLEQLLDLDALAEGCKDVPSLIGVEACVVLLTSLLFVADELRGSRSIETKHQIVADTFVFLAAIIQVVEGCRIELGGAAGQCLCVEVVGEVVRPELGKLIVGARQRGNELLHQKGDIKHHVMPYNGLSSPTQELDDSGETKLFLKELLVFCPLIRC